MRREREAKLSLKNTRGSEVERCTEIMGTVV